MINAAYLQKFFTEDTNPKEFAEVMHSLMADYVRLACMAEGSAVLKRVAFHVDYLEDVRRAVLEADCEPSMQE